MNGGGQIADTGDYSDVECPECGSKKEGEVEKEIIEWMRHRMLSIAKEEAIGFAEWILDKGYRPVGLHLWSITPELDTTDPKNIMVKSSELFDLYLSTKTPTNKS